MSKLIVDPLDPEPKPTEWHIVLREPDRTEPVRVDYQTLYENEVLKNERLVKRITVEANTLASIAEFIKVRSGKERRATLARYLTGVARRLREEAKK